MSLARAAQGFTEASRSLRRGLDSTRGEWNDSARQTFDRQFADHLLLDAQKVREELSDLAAEATAALAHARSAS